MRRRQRLAMVEAGAVIGVVVGSGFRFVIDVAAPVAHPMLSPFVLTSALLVIGVCGVVFAAMAYARRRWPELLDFSADIRALFETPAPRPFDPGAWLARNGAFLLTFVVFTLLSLAAVPNQVVALVVIAAALVFHLAFLVVVSLAWSGEWPSGDIPGH